MPFFACFVYNWSWLRPLQKSILTTPTTALWHTLISIWIRWKEIQALIVHPSVKKYILVSQMNFWGCTGFCYLVIKSISFSSSVTSKSTFVVSPFLFCFHRIGFQTLKVNNQNRQLRRPSCVELAFGCWTSRGLAYVVLVIAFIVRNCSYKLECQP